jgi:hypothetical protein
MLCVVWCAHAGTASTAARVSQGSDASTGTSPSTVVGVRFMAEGSERPDDEQLYTLELAPLLLVNLRQHMYPFASGQLIRTGILASELNDDWRSWEASGLSIIQLRLQLWAHVLRRDTIKLWELSGTFWTTELRSIEVVVPTAGFEVGQY